MIKRTLTAASFSAGLLLSVSSAQAQIPQLPLIGGLLGGGSAFNLPAIDSLGALPGLDILSAGSTDLGPLTGGVFAAQNLMAALGDLSVLVPSSLGPDILFGFVPSSEILYKDPLNVVSYIFDGGTIVASALGPVPAIPVISQPLELGALGLPSLGTAIPVDILPADLLRPDTVINQILSALSGAAASFPGIPTP